MAGDGEPMDLQAWIGRTEMAEDVAGPVPLAGLAALLDYERPPWPPNEVPPLGHWLYFLPRAPMSLIDADGHLKRGGFLPPIDLPRRMWAGGEVQMMQPITIGAPIERRSTIRDVRAKQGASGRLVFVTVDHHITSEGRTWIVERQDIVYREASRAVEAAAAPPPLPPAPRAAQAERLVEAGPVALFRFSALTFNAHRIHYDRDYARDVEGYAGLVVHGPLIAILLADHLLRHSPGARIERFAFRGVRPLIDTAPFALCCEREGSKATLWSRDANGHETMTAEATLG